MCIYKPKGAPALLWELGVQQYLFEERLLSQLRPVAGGQWPVNPDKSQQDPAKVVGGTEQHSVPLSRVSLF